EETLLRDGHGLRFRGELERLLVSRLRGREIAVRREHVRDRAERARGFRDVRDLRRPVDLERALELVRRVLDAVLRPERRAQLALAASLERAAAHRLRGLERLAESRERGIESAFPRVDARGVDQRGHDLVAGTERARDLERAARVLARG